MIRIVKDLSALGSTKGRGPTITITGFQGWVQFSTKVPLVKGKGLPLFWVVVSKW